MHRLPRQPLPLPRSRGSVPGGSSGEPGGVQAGRPDPWPSSADALPAPHSEAAGSANEARGGSARRASLGPVAAQRAIRGLYFFHGRLRKKKNFFLSIRTSEVDEGKIKPVPKSSTASLATAPGAYYLPGGRAGRGARLLPSSRQRPAGPAAVLRGGGGRPGRKHPPPAFARGLAPSRYSPSPQSGPSAPQSGSPRWLGRRQMPCGRVKVWGCSGRLGMRGKKRRRRDGARAKESPCL